MKNNNLDRIIAELFPVTLNKIVDENNDEFVILLDNKGYVYSLELLEMLHDELTKTIRNIPKEDFNQFKVESNKENTYQDFLYFSNLSQGEYPVERLNIKKKSLDPRKKWGFTCGNCAKKVSTKDEGYYYSINPTTYFPFIIDFENGSTSERGCSPDCTKTIAKEIAIESVNKEFKEYFNVSKTLIQIENHIDAL